MSTGSFQLFLITALTTFLCSCSPYQSEARKCLLNPSCVELPASSSLWVGSATALQCGDIEISDKAVEQDEFPNLNTLGIRVYISDFESNSIFVTAQEKSCVVSFKSSMALEVFLVPVVSDLVAGPLKTRLD